MYTDNKTIIYIHWLNKSDLIKGENIPNFRENAFLVIFSPSKLVCLCPPNGRSQHQLFISTHLMESMCPIYFLCKVLPNSVFFSILDFKAKRNYFFRAIVVNFRSS